eukprot:TRINITY_DN10563_c0_g1_i1.p1 TRINITY_DN10563_c0_g1~~TRINITY_DN10563_c0_g1_i1.p1  ORF type:complete len:51 (+),score=0.52 TRINITY_DN10563_c0_g1_i1:186-338(+)
MLPFSVSLNFYRASERIAITADVVAAGQMFAIIRYLEVNDLGLKFNFVRG